MQNTQLLLYRPSDYFRNFERQEPRRTVALGAFLLHALAEAAGAGIPGPNEAAGALAGVLLNWAFSVLLFGVLWFFVGARALGGRGSLDTTIRAVGYAFLWPGLIALPVALAHGTAPSPRSNIGTLVVAGGLGLWTLALAAIGVKHVHSLSWGRTVVVLLWVPVVVLAFAAAILLGVVE
jgi:hypothetical protein